MLKFLILPLVVLLIVALYNIIKQMSRSSEISREKARRKAEYREFMTAYDTRRQLFSEMYNTSRKYKLSGNDGDSMQENLRRCSVDDEATIEYSSAERKYAVLCDGAVLGYLPEQADGVMSKLSRISDYKVIISEMGFTNKDKHSASITIFCNE